MEMQEIKHYLGTKCHTMESLAYKAEFERYDIRVEPLDDDFNAIIAGLYKLQVFGIEKQSLIDEIFNIRSFPRDNNIKRK